MKTICMEQVEKRIEKDEFLESFKLDIFDENTYFNENVDYFSEAVFNNGKKKLEPMLEAITAIKEALMSYIEKQKKDGNDKFDPESFWRSNHFRKLEDVTKKIFGFRSVEIKPYIERYSHKHDEFESRQINAFVYSDYRYPIEGLVTDDGFYDKTHSAKFEMRITLGLIKILEPAEILAIILHEIGHKVDPALTYISYIETNILTKILTDREKKYTPGEKAYIKKISTLPLPFIIIPTAYVLFILVALLPKILKGVSNVFYWIYEKIMGRESVEKYKAEKIRKLVKKAGTFHRHNFDEAFADNFARMYGYGVELSRALLKFEKKIDDKFRDFCKRDIARRDVILRYISSLLKDSHRTPIHRTDALIKEYKADIEDPNVPAKVKENLKEDLAELEKIIDEYTNNFDRFSNRVHKIIKEELEKMNDKMEKDKESKKEETADTKKK